jgi:hypothetical protein
LAAGGEIIRAPQCDKRKENSAGIETKVIYEESKVIYEEILLFI